MDRYAEYQSHMEVISSPKMDTEKREEALNFLADYECWTDYIIYLTKEIDSGRASDRDFLRVALAQLNQLDQIIDCSETCIKYIKLSKPSYEEFDKKLFYFLTEKKSWDTVSSILESVWESFPQQEDKVLVLEKLSFIYDKKLYSEEKLQYVFDKLLSLEPNNKRALKYFKTSHAQNQNWSQVEEVIKRLIQVSENNSEKARFIHELAAIYLYQMDRPKDCLSLIKKSDQSTGPDLTTIHYDALQRTEDWNGCRKILVGLIDSLTQVEEQANVLMRLAELTDQMGQVDKTIKLLDECIKVSPYFYEAYEMKINVFLESKSLDLALETVEGLASIVSGENRHRLQDAAGRFQSR